MKHILEDPSSNANPTEIELKVDQFHGQESGTVVFTGKWRFSSKNSTVDSKWKSFDLQSEAYNSGYPNMIVCLADLVDELRFIIFSKIPEH